MEVIVVSAESPDQAAIKRAAQLLRSGRLVAFPTETVYGLGASGLSEAAVARIYKAKGRPAWNPVIQHVADTEAAMSLTAEWPRTADILARHFWPGPLTLVLRKSAAVPDIATAGMDSTAIRVPAHPVALALLREFGAPVAAPSANRFTQLSPTTAQHVVESLGERVDLILDGGPCSVGIESTVVDLTGPRVVILRPGMVSRAALESVLGEEVGVKDSRLKLDAGEGAAGARSPGQAVRHYSPNAETWLAETGEAREMKNSLAALAKSGKRVAVLARSAEFPERAGVPEGSRVVLMPDTPEEYARMIYAELHDADVSGVHVILIENPPTTGEWDAIRDRLSRAAAIL